MWVVKNQSTRSLGLLKPNECVNVKRVHKSSNLGIWMEKINEKAE